MRTYLLVLVIAAAVTYLLTPLVRRAAVRIGALTMVRDRDVHTIPTPRLGGVAMLGGLAVSLLIASQIPYLRSVFAETSQTWAILAAGAIICMVGAADDIWDLDWLTKLAGQLLAAFVMAWGGVQFITLPVMGLTIGSSTFSLIITVFLVLVIVNAVNFVDGLDGLAAGMVLIGSGAFAVFTYLLVRDASPGNYANVATAILVALVGVCLGFLPHNLHPARIFMGDSGAMLLGVFLAGSLILVTGQIDPGALETSQVIPAFIPILLPVAVCFLPLLEVVTSVFRRVVAGKSPFHPDRMHIHHRLLQLGHSHRHAVFIMHAWTAVISFTAVALAFVPMRYVVVGGLAGALLALAMTLWGTRKPPSGGKQSRSGDKAPSRSPATEPDDESDLNQESDTTTGASPTSASRRVGKTTRRTS